MNHRAPERTDSFPLIVHRHDDPRSTPLRHRARRDVDGSYRLQLVPDQPVPREDIRIVAVAPERTRSAGMLALLALFGAVSLVILLSVGGAWLDMVLG